MCHPQAAVASSFLIVPIAVAALLVALSGESWGQIHSNPPRCQHQVLGKFGLWQISLHVRFLPDPALPWRRPPAPMQLPWLPVRHVILSGPSGACRFLRRSTASQHPGAATDAQTIATLTPGSREAAALLDAPAMSITASQGYDFVETCADRVGEWNSQPYRKMLCAAEVAHQSGVAALVLLCAGFLAELVGSCSLRSVLGRAATPLRRSFLWGPIAALRFALLCYLAAAGTVLFGFCKYTSNYHNRVKLLVSEFVFEYTDNGVAVWPADMELDLDSGSCAFITAGLLALLSGLLLLVADLDRLHPAYMAGADSRGTARRVSQQKPALLLRKRQAKDRSVLGAVILVMVLFVLFLGVVAFFYGRRAVEGGISKALRGPQMSIRMTSRTYYRVRHILWCPLHFAHQLLGNVTRVSYWLLLQTAAHSSRQLQNTSSCFGKACNSTAHQLQRGADFLATRNWTAVSRRLCAPVRFAVKGFLRMLRAIYCKGRTAIRRLKHEGTPEEQEVTASWTWLSRGLHRRLQTDSGDSPGDAKATKQEAASSDGEPRANRPRLRIFKR